MKKLVLLAAAALMTVSASAQTVQESKTCCYKDNWSFLAEGFGS